MTHLLKYIQHHNNLKNWLLLGFTVKRVLQQSVNLLVFSVISLWAPIKLEIRPLFNTLIFLKAQWLQNSKMELREMSISTSFYFVFKWLFKWLWLIETTVEYLLGIFKTFSIFSSLMKMFCLSEYLFLGSGHSTHEKCIFKILFIYLSIQVRTNLTLLT